MLEEDDEISWRSNGAIFIVLHSLEDIVKNLDLLVEEQLIIEPVIDIFFAKYPTEEEAQTEEALSEFSSIQYKSDCLASRLSSLVDATILGACIKLESDINRFCYYNLGEIATESIESLSLINKLEVALGVLHFKSFKGTAEYASLKRLIAWRNAYVHGKCIDRPTKSIKKNHLEHPESYPTLYDEIKQLRTLLEDYISIKAYLIECCVRPEAVFISDEDLEIERYLEILSRYEFNGLGLPI